MNERQIMLHNLATFSFTLLELHLYLDTHPRDMTAIELYNKDLQKYSMVQAEFQKKFGPLSLSEPVTGNKWQWVDNPWPWDYDGEDDNYVGV